MEKYTPGAELIEKIKNLYSASTSVAAARGQRKAISREDKENKINNITKTILNWVKNKSVEYFYIKDQLEESEKDKLKKIYTDTNNDIYFNKKYNGYKKDWTNQKKEASPDFEKYNNLVQGNPENDASLTFRNEIEEEMINIFENNLTNNIEKKYIDYLYCPLATFQLVGPNKEKLVSPSCKKREEGEGEEGKEGYTRDNKKIADTDVLKKLHNDDCCWDQNRSKNIPNKCGQLTETKEANDCVNFYRTAVAAFKNASPDNKNKTPSEAKKSAKELMNLYYDMLKKNTRVSDIKPEGENWVKIGTNRWIKTETKINMPSNQQPPKELTKEILINCFPALEDKIKNWGDHEMNFLNFILKGLNKDQNGGHASSLQKGGSGFIRNKKTRENQYEKYQLLLEKERESLFDGMMLAPLKSAGGYYLAGLFSQAAIGIAAPNATIIIGGIGLATGIGIAVGAAIFIGLSAYYVSNRFGNRKLLRVETWLGKIPNKKDRLLFDDIDKLEITENLTATATDVKLRPILEKIKNLKNIKTVKSDINNNILHCAAAKGIDTIVDKIIDTDTSLLNETNDLSQNALMFASGNGHTTVVNKLLGNTINVNLQDYYDGFTALMYAVLSGKTDVVKLLLDKDDINVNLQDKNGKTALMYAVMTGQKDVVKLLLDKDDINVNLKDENGKTALEMAELKLWANPKYDNDKLKKSFDTLQSLAKKTNNKEQYIKFFWIEDGSNYYNIITEKTAKQKPDGGSRKITKSQKTKVVRRLNTFKKGHKQIIKKPFRSYFNKIKSRGHLKKRKNNKSIKKVKKIF